MIQLSLEIQEKLNLFLEWQKQIKDFSIEDYNHKSISWTSDYTYSIEWDEFDITDSLKQIEEKATIYSCCGDEINKDYMICPTCLEHQ